MAHELHPNHVDIPYTPHPTPKKYKILPLNEAEEGLFIEIRGKVACLIIALKVVEVKPEGELPAQKLPLKVRFGGEIKDIITNEAGVVDQTLRFKKKTAAATITIPGATATFRRSGDNLKIKKLKSLPPKEKKKPEKDTQPTGFMDEIRLGLVPNVYLGADTQTLSFMNWIMSSSETDKLFSIELLAESMQEQYRRQMVLLHKFGIIHDSENPVITGIDDKVYKAPSILEIQHALVSPEYSPRRERIEKYRRPTLLITPFAISLKELVTKISIKEGSFGRHQNAQSTWGLDADKEEDLVYFPKQFSTEKMYPRKSKLKMDHGGHSKRALLNQSNIAGKGWLVSVVDGQDKKRETKSAEKALADSKKEAGILYTPEEALMLLAARIASDDVGTTYEYTALGTYLESFNAVPAITWRSKYNQSGYISIGMLSPKSESLANYHQEGTRLEW